MNLSHEEQALSDAQFRAALQIGYMQALLDFTDVGVTDRLRPEHEIGLERLAVKYGGERFRVVA